RGLTNALEEGFHRGRGPYLNPREPGSSSAGHPWEPTVQVLASDLGIAVRGSSVLSTARDLEAPHASCRPCPLVAPSRARCLCASAGCGGPAGAPGGRRGRPPGGRGP